jgi:hypothetical protein
MAPSTAFAEKICDNNPGTTKIGDSISQGANAAAGDKVLHTTCAEDSGVSNSSLGTLGNKVVNIFSLIVGIVAVIMLIYGGFRYITSGGSTERVGAAKNTIVYAVIGLVIAALAQIIVHFVLFQTDAAVNPAADASQH